MATSQELFFDLVRSDELLDAYAIELEGRLPLHIIMSSCPTHYFSTGFPLDEAANLEKFKFRQQQAPDLFLGVFIPQDNGKRKIIGYICSILSSSTSLTHDSMSTHVAGSSTVCIHSICVEKSWRKMKVATQLLREYLSRLRSRVEAGSVPYERVVLISHEKLIPFYENAGFTNLGTSGVVYGSLPWYELRAELKNMTEASGLTDRVADSTPFPPAASASQTHHQIPEGVWDALLHKSSSSRTGQLLSSFDSIGSVTTKTVAGSLVNKFDLICPREGCGSIILKEGVGKLVERASEQLQPSEVPISPLLPPLPPPSQTTSWWLITPSPMAFENISFSKSIGEKGSRRKLLGCAECEIGPLGWNKEGEKEFWLACSRVAYCI